MVQKKMKSDYFKRQLYFMSSIGLFYIIIIALFAVPLLAAFVVVVIRGVFDFRYIILGGAVILIGFVIFFISKFLIRLIAKIRKDGFLALRQAREQARKGESVQVELFGGLVKLSYAGKNDPQSLSCGYHEPLLIEGRRENLQPETDPIEKLKRLSELKDQGIIEEDEFLLLKKKVIRGFCDTNAE
jgi:hypothetical protein